MLSFYKGDGTELTYRLHGGEKENIMIILKAKALSNGKYEVSDHLGKRRMANEAELKAVIKSKSAIIIGVELNGREQVKEKKISAAEEALWNIYVMQSYMTAMIPMMVTMSTMIWYTSMKRLMMWLMIISQQASILTDVKNI